MGVLRTSKHSKAHGRVGRGVGARKRTRLIRSKPAQYDEHHDPKGGTTYTVNKHGEA